MLYNTIYKIILLVERMKDIKINARAKINIALDVLRKREDGYHDVRMIMQQIDLFDEIHIQETSKSGIHIKTNLSYLPNNSGNIAYKAAALIIEKYNIKKGVQIHITKHIPVAAGLAGGSTDAAAVLKGLNTLWNLGLNTQELMGLGQKLGADVPFCILGGCALAEGIGEVLTPIKGIDCFVVLCKANVRVSTADVYKKLNLSHITEHPNIDAMIQDLQMGRPIEDIRSNMINVLETVTIKEHPIVYNIKRKMMECGSEASLMSGSGPTVFGLFNDYGKAKTAFENLKKLYKETYLVKTNMK